MKKLTLLATTMLIMGVSAAQAGEQSWIDTMKQSVQQWWGNNSETAEVEAYLDEVTIAVPPMTGEEAAQIQPAAGDYVEDIQEDMIENAPGAIMNDEQSFNTGFENGTVTAFEDNMMSADDLANIMPAAGDAEEITDEAVVVAEEAAMEAEETAMEVMDAVEDMQETAETMVDEMVEPAVETQIEETVIETEQAVVETMEEAKEEMAAEMNAAEEMVTDAVEPAAGAEEMVKEEAVETMKEMKSEITMPMADDHTH